MVNVTSLAARLPLVYGAAYSAAKAALSVFTAALQMEETAPLPPGQHAVRFVDLQPGDIRTGFNRAMRFWSGLDDPAQATTAASVRQSLAASDRSLAGAPPPEKVAEALRRIVLWDGGGPLVACGSALQAIGGTAGVPTPAPAAIAVDRAQERRPVKPGVFHVEHLALADAGVRRLSADCADFRRGKRWIFALLRICAICGQIP